MKKAKIFLTALVLSTVLLFPACSSGGGTASTASTASTEAPAVTISAEDLAGNWKYFITEDNIDGVYDVINSSGSGTGLLSVDPLSKEELMRIIAPEADLMTIVFDANGNVSQWSNVAGAKDAMATMYIEMVDILKTKGMEVGLQILGGTMEELQTFLDSQNLTWEQYLDEFAQGIRRSLDTMTDEMLVSGMGDEATIENGVAKRSSGTYRIENNKVIVEEAETVTTLSYNGTTLAIENVVSTSSEASNSNSQAFAKGLELVKVS